MYTDAVKPIPLQASFAYAPDGSLSRVLLHKLSGDCVCEFPVTSTTLVSTVLTQAQERCGFVSIVLPDGRLMEDLETTRFTKTSFQKWIVSRSNCFRKISFHQNVVSEVDRFKKHCFKNDSFHKKACFKKDIVSNPEAGVSGGAAAPPAI